MNAKRARREVRAFMDGRLTPSPPARRRNSFRSLLVVKLALFEISGRREKLLEVLPDLLE